MTDHQHEDADQPKEPQVGDWAEPTLDEARELLQRNLEELAQLAVQHPALARFLSLGFDAIKDVWSGEQAANAKIGESYFALTQRTIDGLFKRLDQSDVGDEERDRIYGLIESLQGQGAAKTSELLDANAKSGEKTRLLMGALITVGISVAVAVYTRRPPQPPSLGI